MITLTCIIMMLVGNNIMENNVNLKTFRQQYPQYNDWSDDRVVKAINRKNQATAQEKKPDKAPETKGLAGIGNDVLSSLQSAPDAFGDMISSIGTGIKQAGRYATSTNPVSTLANIGAGGVESAAGLISSPQMLMRYLADKFPEFGKRMEAGKTPDGKTFRDPTIYEELMNFEKNHGLAAQSPDENSVRSGGGLLFGGKLLTKIPSMLARTGTVAAEQGGEGGDPVHAALLAMIGEKTAKAVGKGINKMAGDTVPENAPPSPPDSPPPPPGSPNLTANMAAAPSSPSGYETISNIPKAAFNVAKSIPEAIKKIPEMAGTAASSGIDAVAGLGATARIPVVPSLMEALSDYIKYKSVKPETLAQRKLFSDISSKDVPQIQERLAAAKRLGLDYLTPAEATLSPFEAAKQGTLGRTSSGSKLLFEKGKQRTGSEGKAIDTLLDTIHNPNELNPKMNEAYEETMKGEVPQEFIDKQVKRPVIQEAIKKLEGNASYRQMLQEELGVDLGSVKPNSFRYWDMVKRVLGDMEEDAKDAKGRATTDSSVKSGTRKTMVDAMDLIKPEYKVARNISERKFTRRKLEDVFDKKTMTGNNFSKFLESKKNFNETMNKLKAFPEAQQQLKDMKLLFGNLIPNDMSIRSAAALKRTSMSEARNKVDAMKQILDEKYGKEHDVAAVNLMTNPEWIKMLSQYLQKNRK